jgi:hypothetical protein
VVLKELVGMLDRVRRGALSVRDIVHFSAEDLGREKTIDQKIEQTLQALIGIAKLYRLALNQAARLESMPKSKRRSVVRAKYCLARVRIAMARLARSIDLDQREQKRLIERIGQAVDRLGALQRGVDTLKRSVEAGGRTAARARSELRCCQRLLREEESGINVPRVVFEGYRCHESSISTWPTGTHRHWPCGSNALCQHQDKREPFSSL